jgi:hypothetical protein
MRAILTAPLNLEIMETILKKTRTWEILFVEGGITKSVLVYGESAIIEENIWINANPNKIFIQISLYK